MKSLTDFSPHYENGDRRIVYLLSFYPHFFPLCKKIAGKHGYQNLDHPIFQILEEIAEEVNTNYIPRDKVEKCFKRIKGFEGDNKKLRKQISEMKTEISRLNMILKLLRIKTDEGCKYNGGN
jgi:hypothetical protein